MPAFKPPWRRGALKNWSICGMNHYHVAGECFLFVAMTKNERCITEEGRDDEYLWNRLCHKAEQALRNEPLPDGTKVRME